MNKQAILLVEDDENLGFLVRDGLEMAGFQVDLFGRAETALNAFHSRIYHLCLLDVMLPDQDGFAIAENIRKQPGKVPIVFLTAMGFKEDRIRGFQLGADDYITKPFNMEELILRVKAILSRVYGENAQATPQVFEIEGLTFNPLNYEIHFDGNTQKLTRKEAMLLEMFFRNPNKVLERDEIQKKIWEDEGYVVGRSLDVFISRLRKILRPLPNFQITNLHGIGYRFETTENGEK